MTRVVNVVPRHIQEQRLDWHGLDLRRVRDKVFKIDLQARRGVGVQVLHSGRGGGHVLLSGDGGVGGKFVHLDEGMGAGDEVVDLSGKGCGRF